MKAAVMEGLGRLRVQEVETPAIRAGALLLRVRACGVCGSDLKILANGNARVKPPAIIGHELVGEIIGIGEGVQGFARGERVAVGADIPCGECAWCRSGRSNCCDTNYAMGHQFSGGFAEYCLLEPLVVRGGAVVKVPEGVSDEEAACMEPLACCINGMERVGSPEGRSVLIIGAGPIGALLALLARAKGARMVLLADISPERLEAVRPVNADGYIESGDPERLRQRVLEATAGQGADIVFTACPVPEVQEEAVGLAARRGVVNFFGGLGANARMIRLDSNLLHYGERTLTGSHGSLPRQNAEAMELIASGRVPVGRLAVSRVGLADIAEAFRLRKDLKALRVIVYP